MEVLVSVWVAAGAVLAGPPAHPQVCGVGPPFGVGSVAVLPGPCPDGTGPLPGTTCVLVQVNCDGLAPVTAQVRVTEPPPGALPRGTVVFGTGGGGASFYSGSAGVLGLFQTLNALGCRIVERKWAPPEGWMAGQNGLRRESCRYATLLTWVHDAIHATGAFCVTGNSGGSAEIGYALTTWGRGDILDLAVPTSGPPLGRLDYACPYPPAPEWTALCHSIVPPGVMQCNPACSFGPSSHPVCFDCTPAPTLADLRSDSVVHEDATLSYPRTRTHFLFGDLDCGQSVPMGLTWATVVASEKIVGFVQNTPHALFSTAGGREAIRSAIATFPWIVATGDVTPGGTLSIHAFGPPGAPALLFAGLVPASFTVPGLFGIVGIADPLFLASATIGSSETFVWTFPLDPSLAASIGIPVRFQALLFPRLTNAEVVTLQP